MKPCESDWRQELVGPFHSSISFANLAAVLFRDLAWTDDDGDLVWGLTDGCVVVESVPHLLEAARR